MKPSNLPKLTPWPGLDPDTGGPSAPAPWELAARKRGIPWGWLLIVLVIGGLITTLIIERKRANETTAKLSREIPAPTPQGNDPITDGSGTIAKALPVDEKKLPQECLLTPTESEALVRSLLDRLFSDAPNEDRLATIADAATNKESLASFFTKHPNVHLTHLSIISTPVRCLPAKAPQAIFDIMTTLSSKNSGIARLTTDDDGQLKLDWLLLQDSLDGAFASYQTQKPGVIPQWITLGLRRNHGFGEPADMRQENLFFDMQGYGNGGDKNMVLVVKNSSTGRAMDAAIGWGDLVIARVLIGWQNFKGVPRLTVINTILDESGVGS